MFNICRMAIAIKNMRCIIKLIDLLCDNAKAHQKVYMWQATGRDGIPGSVMQPLAASEMDCCPRSCTRTLIPAQAGTNLLTLK
jgi:hypothetical protein